MKWHLLLCSKLEKICSSQTLKVKMLISKKVKKTQLKQIQLRLMPPILLNVKKTKLNLKNTTCCKSKENLIKKIMKKKPTLHKCNQFTLSLMLHTNHTIKHAFMMRFNKHVKVILPYNANLHSFKLSAQVQLLLINLTWTAQLMITLTQHFSV